MDGTQRTHTRVWGKLKLNCVWLQQCPVRGPRTWRDRAERLGWGCSCASFASAITFHEPRRIAKNVYEPRLHFVFDHGLVQARTWPRLECYSCPCAKPLEIPRGSFRPPRPSPNHRQVGLLGRGSHPLRMSTGRSTNTIPRAKSWAN